MIIRALVSCERKLYAESKIPSFIARLLIKPSVANNDLKIIAYATSDVAQGKKIAVLKNPLNFTFGLLRIEAKINAKISITGT